MLGFLRSGVGVGVYVSPCKEGLVVAFVECDLVMRINDGIRDGKVIAEDIDTIDCSKAASSLATSRMLLGLPIL